jgi:hypothetical protein
MDVVRRLHVAGNGGYDRAHLLVACEHQEGRGTPVRLDADRVEARLGVRKFAMAMRRHGTAGM